MSFHDHRTPRIAAVLPTAKRQYGPVTLAIRAMRAAYGINAKAPARRAGPVTEAIRTMRAAVPDFDANPDLIALRRALANRIETDIAALDMLGGDPDLESDFVMEECAANGTLYLRGRSSDDEPSLCGAGTHEGGVLGGLTPSQGGDDREDENEHGGDVQDEPHDPEEDGDVHEIGTAVAGFDGTNYLRTSLNRRVSVIPRGVVIVGPDGAGYTVSRVAR